MLLMLFRLTGQQELKRIMPNGWKRRIRAAESVERMPFSCGSDQQVMLLEFPAKS